MSADLVTWLRAQYEDDERVAREAAGEGPHSSPHWVIDREFHPPTPYIRQLGIYASPSQAPGHVDPEQCEHIARWDPARVLAEIGAKRLILEELDSWLRTVPAEPEYRDAAEVRHADAGDLLRLLALAFADRDGYDEEWRL